MEVKITNEDKNKSVEEIRLRGENETYRDALITVKNNLDYGVTQENVFDRAGESVMLINKVLGL